MSLYKSGNISVRLTILNSFPKVTFESINKKKKETSQSIKKELKIGKFLIFILSILALVCLIGIVYELAAIYFFELRDLPKEGFWFFCICTIQIIMLPQTWMRQNILKHKLELLENGEVKSPTPLIKELQEILSAKKGIIGAAMIAPIFIIFLVTALSESARVMFGPFALPILILLLSAYLLLWYDTIKYNRSFNENVKSYQQLTTV